jgi:alpha-methylacyl-CoA racemase
MSINTQQQSGTKAAGPLAGVTVVELAAIGPVPFATFFLQRLGAEIIVIDPPNDRGLGLAVPPQYDYLMQGKRRRVIDLKAADGPARLFDVLRTADVLVEGFRPGTLERLALSPQALHAVCPWLIIGRCSGWGTASARAHTAGHDINYLALSGALSAVGESAKPIPPLNLVGDYGGAGMHLVAGILSALFRRQLDGSGTVVDASIFEGATSLMTMFYGLADAGQWQAGRASNMLDGGAPYYSCYETADGGWMAVGAIERKFFAAFVQKLQADDIDIGRQNDRDYWPELRMKIGARIKQCTRDAWDSLFRDTDCCCTPVLDLHHARAHADVAPMFDGAVPKVPLVFTGPK